jgi:spermidine synthase
LHFDAIVSNTTWHFRANITNLLSSEFLALVRQHLNPGGIFFYNTTGSRRAQRTACTTFPHGARFTNHMVVSDTPIDWNLRGGGRCWRITGKAEFDPNDDADQSRIDPIMNDYRRGGPMIEECPELLSATEGTTLMTDDNMDSEWRYYLHLEPGF